MRKQQQQQQQHPTNLIEKNNTNTLAHIQICGPDINETNTKYLQNTGASAVMSWFFVVKRIPIEREGFHKLKNNNKKNYNKTPCARC